MLVEIARMLYLVQCTIQYIVACWQSADCQDDVLYYTGNSKLVQIAKMLCTCVLYQTILAIVY